jgi:hypothetical protein
VLAFTVVCAATHAELPVPGAVAVVLAAAITLALAGATVLRARIHGFAALDGVASIGVLAAGGTLLVLTTLYQFAGYFRIPADLLSFAESPFVTDILKIRLGLPLYTPAADNNSYPYTPGTQILTYFISSLFGHGDSIPFYRVVQFSYVIGAATLATSIFDMLALRFLSPREYRNRALWVVAAFPLLLLVATDPHINLYIQSLHNDGLALLVNVLAYWLITRYSMAPRLWLFVPMAVLPAIGFLVKQNAVMWAGLFPLCLLIAGNASFRRVVLLVLASGAAVAAVVATCYVMWGEPFRYWVFESLGSDTVSPLRSLQHLLLAGAYAALGLLAARLLWLRAPSRTALALWLCWLLPFALEAYTSGVGWQPNHLGTGIVLATCWSLVALVRLWPSVQRTMSGWHYRAEVAIALSSIFLVIGALGLIREPRSLVPPDLDRYIADIEREFDGLPADKVLMDTGTWIYLRDNVMMKDRSPSVSMLSAVNLPEIDRASLAETIQRIGSRQYAKILARQLDTGESWYDYHDRGSGVKDAILANYQIVRRIPAVQGVDVWWPLHLISEVLVLVPR